ncbi:uncharacterized protein LOC131680940 [Topomyia yanbarensis]|uniref:uncharacterized protein LOC131680940 n=1 Tax=Topomyia yanbarensis TaxID=2498891 RepID=UPI00273A9FA9|nr:uncharacterized protein LOC131680940 [Topomyia yanbarensis]
MVATVKACELDDYLYNVSLLQELVDRLPPMIKLNWAVHRQSLERSTLILFRYVPVILHGPESMIYSYAFLDDRSSLTLLENELATELMLEGTSHPLCLRWTADTCRYENSSTLVSLEISGVQNSESKYRLTDVHTVKELKLPSQPLTFDELSKKHGYLEGLPIDSYIDVRPRILIGINNWRVGHILDSRESGETDLIAAKTRLGWMLHGSYTGRRIPKGYMTHHSYAVCTNAIQNDDDLHNTVKSFFSLDSLGIMQPSKSVTSSEDERALTMMRALTVQKGNRYQTGLLWKFDDVRLPNNKSMAMRRFHYLERKMANEPRLAESLKAMIEDYIKKGYARRLYPDEIKEQHYRVWYLPMFPVFNPNKPGKLRIVWDAAAAVNDVSLNSVLMKGPDQLTELPSVLYRFREHPVAIGGDIREMFHQVLINETDQQYQRFLWRSDARQNNPDVYVLTVMSFGATCSPSCAQ